MLTSETGLLARLTAFIGRCFYVEPATPVLPKEDPVPDNPEVFEKVAAIVQRYRIRAAALKSLFGPGDITPFKAKNFAAVYEDALVTIALDYILAGKATDPAASTTPTDPVAARDAELRKQGVVVSSGQSALSGLDPALAGMPLVQDAIRHGFNPLAGDDE